MVKPTLCAVVAEWLARCNLGQEVGGSSDGARANLILIFLLGALLFFGLARFPSLASAVPI